MISAIVTVDKNNGIGNNGDRQFVIPKDIDRFTDIVSNKSIIMGRKTFDLIKEPLKYCNNIVVTRNNKMILESAKTNLEIIQRMNNNDEDTLNMDSYLVISSLDSVIAYIINNIKNKSEDEIIIIGGGEIYKELLPYCNKIYMTKYNKSFENDTYFEIPNDIDEWEVTYKSEDEEYDGATFNFLTYERKAKDCTINEDGEVEWTIEPLNE